MKVDNVDNVDEVAVSRGVFIASFSAFIFTSLFSIALASSGFVGGSEVATAYYSGSQIKANVLTAQVGTATTAVTYSASMSAITNPVTSGSKAKLIWSTKGYTTCALETQNGTRYPAALNNTAGSETGPITADTTFWLMCQKVANGTVAQAAMVTVKVGAAAPVTPPVVTAPVDKTPRIAYWTGKVNSHIDINTGLWTTDSDGVSGSTIDKLVYCKKFYPNTTSVSDYKTEMVYPWRAAGTSQLYSQNTLSYKCVAGTVVVPPAVKPTVTLSITPSVITAGTPTSVKLTWTSTNATKCLVKKNGVTFIDNLLNGTAPVTEYNPATFSVDCTGNGGTASATAGLTLNNNIAIVQGPTSVTIAANPTKVVSGASTMVSFTLTPNLTGCLVTKNNIETPNSPFLKPEFSMASGVSSGALKSDTTFTIKCTGKIDKKEYKAQALVIVDKQVPVQKVLTQLYVNPTTVAANGEVMVSWTSKYADSCVLSKSNYDAAGKIVNTVTMSTLQYGSNLPSGKLTQTTKFMITCKNAGGSEVSYADVKVGAVVPVGEKPAVTINTNPTSVAANGQVLVSYASKLADSCIVTKANVDTAGNLTNKTQFYAMPYASNLPSGKLTSNTRFLLECKNKAGTSSTFADVKVATAPLVDFTAKITANPMQVEAGKTTNISWTSTGATSCNIYSDVYTSGALGGYKLWKSGLTGTNIVSLPITKDTGYQIACLKDGKTVSSYVTITVKPGVVIPPVTTLTAKIWATPMEVTAGQTTNISWTSTGAKFCNVYENDGNTLWKTGLNASNTVSLPLSKDRQYTLSCSMNGKTVASSVIVKVKSIAATVKPTVRLTVSPATAKIGSSVNINWTSTNADKCTLMKGTTLMSSDVKGDIKSGALSESTVFWLTCTNKIGSYSDAAAVQVN